MNFVAYLESLNQQVADIKPVKISGKVTAVKGLIIETIGINDYVSIGSRCKIRNLLKGSSVLCEVVGFNHDNVLLMTFEDTEGVGAGAPVEVYQHANDIMPDRSWLGRVINAFGNPIDEKGPLKSGQFAYPLKANPPASQKRNRVGGKIDLGVKAIGHC